MTLTKTDLGAIKSIVDDVVVTNVSPMLGSLDTKIDSLAAATAAGFEEVHEKVDHLSDKIDVIDGKLDDTIKRVEILEKERI